MPDIRPANQYIGRMRKVERQTAAAIFDVYKGFRRNALDILNTEKVRLGTIPVLRRELDSLRTAVTNIMRGRVSSMDELVIWYASQQMNLLRNAGETNVPSVQDLNIRSQPERQTIYQNILMTEPRWVSDLAQGMETNLTRLAISGASVQTAVDRLLALNIADGRASVFRMGSVAAETQVQDTIWTVGSLSSFGMWKVAQTITHIAYEKQAIATIDAQTTDCCLRVHGQIQPLEKPFILEGTPRFADKVANPPFHWHCRTAETLHTLRMEEKGIPTTELIDAAQAELRARAETGKRERIWPSSATSRRGQ